MSTGCNRLRIVIAVLAVSLVTLGTETGAEAPRLELGEKPSFGLFQPRVTVEIVGDDGQSFGPAANTFLLDTGASGVLLYPPATTEVAELGFENEGEPFEEAGISGSSFFDVSKPYQLLFNGATTTESIDDVRFLSGSSPPDPTGLMGLNGIVGMPALAGRVTTLNNQSREGAPSLSMAVSFADELPAALTHRFTVPLTELSFPAEGSEPLPTFESLSTLELVSRHGANEQRGPIVLDSGAQVTIISEALANQLGLDANGNDDFADDAIATVPLSGATGTINAPVLVVDEMRIPTEQGFDLVWRNAEVVVQDIHPSIPGVLGADFMSGDGNLDFSFLGGGLEGLDLGDLLGDLGGLEDLLGGLGGLEDLLGGLGGLEDLLGGLGGLDDLLGGLGGLDLGGLLGGGGDLFASFPLESYFDRVHFDFREFPDSAGQLVFDLNSSLSAQILNGDHVFNVEDVDDLTQRLGSTDLAFDLDDDGLVTLTDHGILIQDVLGTTAGDANLDGKVDFGDFLTLSNQFGESQAGWSDGDFDADGEVQFSDFLLLSSNFQTTGSARSVPEPTGTILLTCGGLVCLLTWRTKRRTKRRT